MEGHTSELVCLLSQLTNVDSFADTLRHWPGTGSAASYTELHALSLCLLYGSALPRWHHGGTVVATQLLQISASHIGREVCEKFRRRGKMVIDLYFLLYILAD